MSQSQAIVDQVIAHNKNGYNCAQSVLLALYLHMYISGETLIPKIAAGFGGGIGRCGSVCGAWTGSIMAVGIKNAPNEPGIEKRTQTYAHAKALYNQFETEPGTVFVET